MNKYPKLQDLKWLEEQLKTRIIADIAREIGCTYSAVQYTLRKNGLKVPHRSTYTITERKSIAQKEAYKKKYPNGRFGENHPNWKGGRRLTNLGYIRIYLPTHPRTTKTNPYVFEHIVVAEKTLGRYLDKDEIVHHINHDKQDNRPENLQVTKRGEHVTNHFKEGKRTALAELEIARLKSLLDKHNIKH